MLTFLFWNIGGDLPSGSPQKEVQERENRLLALLKNLTQQHDVDTLILAESPTWSVGLDQSLSDGLPQGRRFRPPDPRTLCERIAIFHRYPTKYLKILAESAKFTCRHLTLPGRENVLLLVAHLSSKRYRSDASQSLSLGPIGSKIREAEGRVKHTRTILLGDLNMNPFEDGIVGAEGLNATMSRDVALQEARTVDEKDYPFFYNPMWSHFGDSTHEVHPVGSPEHEPPGTCFYSAGESRWYYWNMFDQLMIRPSLLDRFRDRDLRIIVTDGTTSLLDAHGRPDRKAFSDHLPILFRLHL